MTKQITHEMTYDASLPQVAAMLVDPAFRREVCERQGVISSQVAVEPRDGGTDVRIEQVHPAAGIPSVARKFVGDAIHIVQAEAWGSTDRADVTITIPGKPADTTGRVVLVEAGGRTTETVDLTVKVGVPIVGSRIEGLIADLLLKALRIEERVGREWLARS